MNLKSKLLTSIATMSLAAALVGGATFALFTANTTNSTNTITAGSITISADQGSFTAGQNFDKIAPGDTISGSFTVTNTGNLGARIDQLVPTGNGGLFDGTLGDFPAEITVTSGLNEEIAPDGGTATVTYEVHLPIEADDDYQNAIGNASFYVHAVQTANNPLVTVTP